MSTEQRNGEQVKPDDVRELFRAERLGWRHGRRSTRISLSAIANFEELTSGFEGVDELKLYEEASDKILRQHVELAEGYTWADEREVSSVAMAISAALFGRMAACHQSPRISSRSSLIFEEGEDCRNGYGRRDA